MRSPRWPGRGAEKAASGQQTDRRQRARSAGQRRRITFLPPWWRWTARLWWRLWLVGLAHAVAVLSDEALLAAGRLRVYLAAVACVDA